MGPCRRVLALTLCAAMSCAPPPATVRPAPPVRVIKHYAPLGMRADAKQPGQAVILGTDETDGATVLPLPAGPTTAVVDATYVSYGGTTPPSGATIALTLTASASAAPAGTTVSSQPTTPSAAANPARDESSSSGIAGAASTEAAPRDPNAIGAASSGGVAAVEDPAAAAWQAGVATAAQVATGALGKDVADVALSAAPAVPGDAGASALLASGFLAAMTGDRVDPAATLAGMVLPDGTIAPVAGLPEQVMAAIERGKTRVGYPAAMRTAPSLSSGKDVDLVRLARAHHAEAVEVATVADAYLLLTRKALPTPLPVSEAEMAVDADTAEHFATWYVAWRRRLADEWAALLQLEQAGRLPPLVKRLARIARERSEQAEALHRAGAIPGAYRRVVSAWIHAAAANASSRVLARVQAGDVDGAAGALAAGSTDTTPGAVLSQIAALRPASLASHLAAIAALEAALRGWSYDAFAVEAARATAQLLEELKGRSTSELGAPATADAIASAVVPAALMQFRAAAETAEAVQRLELEPGAPSVASVAYAASPSSMQRLAAAFQAAGAGAVRHVDHIVVEPLVRSAQLGEDAARRRVAIDEPGLVSASALARLDADALPPDLAASWADGLPPSILGLAAHALAYRDAALLVVRHQALAAHVDDAGKLELAHPAALRTLLAAARRAARASARAARIATGAIPLPARLAYQRALLDETGGLDDQLDALGELWTATAFSDLAVSLARN